MSHVKKTQEVETFSMYLLLHTKRTEEDKSSLPGQRALTRTKKKRKKKIPLDQLMKGWNTIYR